MQDLSCVFCKIVAAELPCFKVYEDEATLAFLDIRPVLPGHTLVVPKKHFPDFASAPDALLCRLAQAAQKVAAAVLSATASPGFNLSTANGRAAGQEVMHLHFHIIPRTDRLEHEPWKQGEYKEGEAAKVAAAIKAKLGL